MEESRADFGDVLTADRLDLPWGLPNLACGFFGRRGGVSAGAFATLNLSYSVGDDSSAVDQNWRIARASMPAGAAIAKLNQIHGKAVHTVVAGFEALPSGDGLVTATSGIVLAILTADCVPVLMADPERGVVAALHAGWRGTLAGIAAEGVRAMAALGAAPGRILAALGPSIGPCCFEVDQTLADRFEREAPGSARHSRPGRAGKAYIDLRGVLRDQLAHCRVRAIAGVGPCTRCASDRYFSRRAAGGNTTGLQLSYIALAGQSTG